MSDSNITKKALATALQELMQEKSLSKISVGDICQRCGMNRKSFYYHFKDKYDLVNWIFYTEFFDLIHTDTSQGWELLLQLCEYFAAHQKFYQNALEIRGQNSFYEYFGDVLASVISENLESLFLEGEYHDFYVALFVDAFRAVILRWLVEGCKIPAKEFVTLLRNATMGLGYRALQDAQVPLS